jgi:heat shock protein HslJ
MILAASCSGTETAEEPLPGTSWRATEIAGRAALGEKAATLEFRADGGVGGSTSCNRFSGNATIEGQTLTFSPLASTRMACEPPVMDQETRFLQALASVRSFARSGDTLTLRDGDEAAAVKLTRLAD